MSVKRVKGGLSWGRGYEIIKKNFIKSNGRETKTNKIINGQRGKRQKKSSLKKNT